MAMGGEGFTVALEEGYRLIRVQVIGQGGRFHKQWPQRRAIVSLGSRSLVRDQLTWQWEGKVSQTMASEEGYHLRVQVIGQGSVYMAMGGAGFTNSGFRKGFHLNRVHLATFTKMSSEHVPSQIYHLFPVWAIFKSGIQNTNLHPCKCKA